MSSHQTKSSFRVMCSFFFLLACLASVKADDNSPYHDEVSWRQVVPKKYQTRSEYKFVQEDPALPNVLLIGDSISMQYTVGVRKLLQGQANVYRAPDNCRSTRQSLAEIETYLGDKHWDVIHFNWGIHDVTHLNDAGKVAAPPKGSRQVPLGEYQVNFRKLITRLQETDASLIWATTTPIGKQTEARGYRRDQDVVAYNAAALEILPKTGVALDDLYDLVKPQAETLLSDGVHFKSNGAEVLAKAVAQAIQKQLPK
ncbi:SGNH/GDSL hydrolase family protein [Bremerella alba]|uniref:SGNH hydrolase-type esterase domain-containing protein n=1 Tax=Bremerella alba TaxID=980252 RepID=A0A7V9A806_9BACT|nr:SGNH/GDSL hydrolase family protein [Bremerella alba]MBA2115566.1 hypothetical protein [Bremerella alba]